MRYQSALTIPICLRRGGVLPLYEQIAGQIGTAVDDGRLAVRTALPSTRTLAGLLGVSRGVVAASYDLLVARGYLEGRTGSGTYVAAPVPGPPGGTVAAPDAAPPGGTADLRPGGPVADGFPVRAWRAAWRRASYHPPTGEAPPPLGLPELRRAIAAHLRGTRGLPLAGYEVVVTAGPAAALRLVLEALGLAGAEVAVEEPGPPALRRAVPPGDRHPVPLPVDAAGVRVGSVPAGCRAMVLGPDAHDPYGHVLSAGRRAAAAAWATGTGGWLVEVACDAVFRPPACRLPRLVALAPGATVVVGGFGAGLGPGLGLGYALVPAALAGPVGRLLAGRGDPPADILQRVVADLLDGGVVTGLMHRLGRVHRRQWPLVEAALWPVCRLAGSGAVGTAVLYPRDRRPDPSYRRPGPPGPDGPAVAAALAGYGVRVHPLAEYHVDPPAAARCALVIGYGHLPDPALRAALARLASGLSEMDWGGAARRDATPTRSTYIG